MSQQVEAVFQTSTYHTYEQGERGGTWGFVIRALSVKNAPKEMSGFIVAEEHWTFGHPNINILHYYSTQKEMENAFFMGLTHYFGIRSAQLTRTKGPSTSEEMMDELFGDAFAPLQIPFNEFPGHVQTANLEEGVRPWFTALADEKIEGHSCQSTA